MAKTKLKKEYNDKLREDILIRQIIAARLCHLRESVKPSDGCTLTIKQLANLIDLHHYSVWLFENARRGMTIETLVKLKNALGCSWDDLLDGCESKIAKGRAKFLNIDTRSFKKRDGEAFDGATVGEILGANLRHLRESTKTAERRTLSREQLARLTALNHSSIWRFENGKSGMTVATLVRLKEAFGCEWGDLLGGCEGQTVKEREKK